MPKMQFVTDAMISRANTIGQGVQSILDSQNSVTKTFQNMGRNFSGRVPELMIQHMLAMDKEYQNMNRILTGYKTFMEEAAQTYEWTDNELARWAEALGRSDSSASSTSSAASTPTETASTSESSSAGQRTEPDFNSTYYRGDNPQGIQRAYGKQGQPGHIDCCFYARSRAMEVRGNSGGYGSFSKVGIDEVKNGDRVVLFNWNNGGTHFVYVESYDPSTDTVYFSDANMTNHADGLLQSMSYSDFQTFGGKASCTHVEIPA